MTTTMQRWLCLTALLVLMTGLLAGCGGGGGGGSSNDGGNSGSSTATVTGVLQDQTTMIKLANRTVTVQNTSLSGVTDTNGSFTIANVPVQTVTLVVTDSNGTSNGTVSIDVSKASGSPRNLGTITLNLSSSTSPPKPPF